MSKKHPAKPRYNEPKHSGYFEKRYGQLFSKWQSKELNPPTQHIPHDAQKRVGQAARHGEQPEALHR